MLVQKLVSLATLATLASCVALPNAEAAPPPPPSPPSPPPPPPGGPGGPGGPGSQGRWDQLASIVSNGKSYPRQEHSVVSVGTDVYALGGIEPFDGTTYPTVAKVQKYSTTSGQWSDLPNMPAALNHANVAVVKDKIYVCGGLAVTATGGPAYWGPSGSCSVFDPKTSQWTQLSDMPKARAVGAAAVMVSGDTIYYAGGLKYTNLTNDDEGTVSLFTSYNTATKAWTNLPDMPAPRDHAGKGVVGDSLYVLGGRSFGHYNVAGDSYAFSIRKCAWQTGLPSMPTPRGGVASSTIGNLIYIAGGEGDRDTTSQVFPQMEAYDTKANRWLRLANMARPVHGTDGTPVGGKMYIPGGGSAIGGAPTDWLSSFTP